MTSCVHHMTTKQTLFIRVSHSHDLCGGSNAFSSNACPTTCITLPHSHSITLTFPFHIFTFPFQYSANGSSNLLVYFIIIPQQIVVFDWFESPKRKDIIKFLLVFQHFKSPHALPIVRNVVRLRSMLGGGRLACHGQHFPELDVRKLALPIHPHLRPSESIMLSSVYSPFTIIIRDLLCSHWHPLCPKPRPLFLFYLFSSLIPEAHKSLFGYVFRIFGQCLLMDAHFHLLSIRSCRCAPSTCLHSKRNKAKEYDHTVSTWKFGSARVQLFSHVSLV